MMTIMKLWVQNLFYIVEVGNDKIMRSMVKEDKTFERKRSLSWS